MNLGRYFDTWTNCRPRAESLLPRGSQGRVAFEELRGIFGDSSDQGIDQAVLQPIRTLWAFHYKEERFSEALRSVSHDKAEMITCPHHGLGRYTFVDQLVSTYSLQQICSPFGGIEAVVKRLMRLTGSLATASDSILAALFEQDGVGMDVTEGMVTLPL